MNRRKLSTSLRVIVATMTVAGCSTAAASADGPDPGVVTAVFADASPLVSGFTVRSHGVKIGEIESLEVKDGSALVRMRIDESAGRPLHNDATAKIRPVSLLGERYIDFDRGTPNAPVLPVGQPIDAAHTASAVDLSDVLNTVDNPTGTALAAFITTIGEGEKGRGSDIDAALALLAPSLQRTDGLVKLLNEQNDVLSGLIDHTAPVAGALASQNGRDLDGLLESTELLLRTTAANQRALDTSIVKLPQTLTDARATLSRLAGVGERGAETLGRLRPLTDSLPQITGEINEFTDAANPALANLDPVLRRGEEFLDKARPLVATLRPAGADLRSVSGSARPIVADLTKDLHSVLELVRNWSMCANGFDGVSNYFRGIAVVDPDSATGNIPHGLLPVRPHTPGPLDEAGSPASGLPMLGGARAPNPDNATGLRPRQEKDMFGQLLGGG
jgi:phospholipid/cholesterol/gamma-HCH transport system substrate-binding protein